MLPMQEMGVAGSLIPNGVSARFLDTGTRQDDIQSKSPVFSAPLRHCARTFLFPYLASSTMIDMDRVFSPDPAADSRIALMASLPSP